MGFFNTHPSVEKYWLPLIGGGLFAMGFPMKSIPHFFPLAILGPALLLNALSLSWGKLEINYHRIFPGFWSEVGSVLMYSLGYCMVGYYWIPYTLNEFGSIPVPFNYVLGILFSLIIVPQFFGFVIFHRIIKRINFKTSPMVSSISTRNCLFAILLVLFEYYIPQQFPGHPGHAWLQLAPWLGMAPVLGVPFFSFISYWLMMALVCFFKTRRIDFFAIVATLAFVVLNFTTPLKFNQEENESSINLRMVQANIGNFIKLNSEKGKMFAVQEVLQTYQRLSTVKNDFKPDLIIWPETAFPHLLNSSLMTVNDAFIPKVFRDVVSETGAQLYTGGYDKAESNNKNFYETEYNTGFLFNSNGEFNDVYYKRLLIPFGEHLPFGPLNPWIAKIVSNIAYFATGDRFTLFKTEKGPTFISAICYEILFSAYIRNYLNSNPEHANFIVNLTNDSWYGDTAEPWQHKYLTHWRALEFNIPIARMTNTGITSILYPDGGESENLGLFKEGVLDIKVNTPERSPTLFQKFGMGVTLMVCAAIYLFLIIMAWVSNKKKSRNDESLF